MAALLDEYADMAPRAWPEVIRPAFRWTGTVGRCSSAHRVGRTDDFWRVHQHAEIDPEWFS